MAPTIERKVDCDGLYDWQLTDNPQHLGLATSQCAVEIGWTLPLCQHGGLHVIYSAGHLRIQHAIMLFRERKRRISGLLSMHGTV